jgi:hypothetical protein
VAIIGGGMTANTVNGTDSTQTVGDFIVEAALSSGITSDRTTHPKPAPRVSRDGQTPGRVTT